MSQTSPTGSGAPAPTGRPGRYNRSFGGLIGSMIVLVLVVLGIVIFRGTFRDTPEYEPEPIDYLELVTSVQQAGLKPVYPPQLPEGWSVKDAGFDSGDRPSFDLVFTTEDAHTVGLHQEDADATSLVKTLVGDGATSNDARLKTDLGTWEGWTDTDGDHAWTTERGRQTVLVYSTGDPDELESFVDSLTTATLQP